MYCRDFCLIKPLWSWLHCTFGDSHLQSVQLNLKESCPARGETLCQGSSSSPPRSVPKNDAATHIPLCRAPKSPIAGGACDLRRRPPRRHAHRPVVARTPELLDGVSLLLDPRERPPDIVSGGGADASQHVSPSAALRLCLRAPSSGCGLPDVRLSGVRNVPPSCGMQLQRGYC